MEFLVFLLIVGVPIGLYIFSKHESDSPPLHSADVQVDLGYGRTITYRVVWKNTGTFKLSPTRVKEVSLQIDTSTRESVERYKSFTTGYTMETFTKVLWDGLDPLTRKLNIEAELSVIKVDDSWRDDSNVTILGKA